MNTNILKGLSIVWIVAALILGGVVGYSLKGQTSAIGDKRVSLQNDWRKLWEDHVTWTRLVIIDIADNLGSLDNDTKRLVKNYDDMENGLKEFYGKEKAEKVGDLLKDHLVIAAELVKAAKAGESAKAKDKEVEWFKNADDIAAALNEINPSNWLTAVVKDMLYGHLKLTKEEAVARITKSYDSDIAAYDKIHFQALMMADAFSSGIIKQFPGKF